MNILAIVAAFVKRPSNAWEGHLLDPLDRRGSMRLAGCRPASSRAGTSHFHDGAERHRAQHLLRTIPREYVTATGRLSLAGVKHVSAGNDRVPTGWPHKVQLEFRCQHVSEHRSRGERQSQISEVAYDPTVHEAVLLLEVIVHGHDELRSPIAEDSKPGPK